MKIEQAAGEEPPEPAGLGHLLQQTDRFLFAAEMGTTRGLFTDERAATATRVAREVADSGRIDFISISDNPFGSPHSSPEILGEDLIARGQEVVINFSCKDSNRNGIESRLWALASSGFHNILAVTGDYPADGFSGAPRPVFDIDSVGLLEMMRQMNGGLPIQRGRKGALGERLSPTAFYPGATVNPFKRHEGELIPQLLKLAKKTRLGARWIVTQMGYDFRRLGELRHFMRLKGLDVPALGSVYVLSLPAARYFRRGNVPGVSLSAGLLELIEKRAGGRDRGAAFFNEFAAKQLAALKGMGYRGVYLCCRSPLSRVDRILEIEASFGPDDWKGFAREFSFPDDDGFYLFEEDAGTGLSTDEFSRDYLASKSSRWLGRLSRPALLNYGANRLVHNALLDADGIGFRMGRAVYEQVERSRLASKLVHAAEQAFKIPVYGCEDCGDCSLPDVAYLCPEGQCYKNQRNGPCGGTKEGTCEVGDEECIWSRAYKRLKAYGEEERMLDGPVVLQNAALKRTSAWANTFLGRDHFTRQRGEATASDRS